MIKYVIFDMDGVIYDSEILFIRSFVEAVGPEMGVNCTYENMKAFLGMNDEDSVELFYKMHGRRDYMDATVIGDRWTDAYIKEHGLGIKPGAKELLTWLRERHIPVALASGSPEHLIKRDLDITDMWSYFDIIINGDQVSRGKPHPDIFELAAQKLGCSDASECLVIEDSLNGVKAADNGHFPVFVVPDLIDPTENSDIVYTARLETLFDAIPLLEKMIC